MFSNDIRNNRNSIATFTRGDVVSAFVTEKRNGFATLEMQNGFSFQVDANKIVGEIGDELTFSVEQFDRDGIILRQLGISSEMGSGQIEAALTGQTVQELFNQAGFTREIDVFDDDFLNEQAQTAEALARIRHQISFSASNISPNVIGTLVASGISIQNIDINMLTAAIREVKASEHFEGSYDIISDSKFAALSELDEAAVMNLLKDEAPLTLDNIYVAKHAGSELNDGNDILPEAWKQLEAEVAKLFDKEGIVATKEIEYLWKMMVENGVPVTVDNIQKALFLLNIDGYDIANLTDKSSVLRSTDDLFELFTSFDPNLNEPDFDANKLINLLESVTEDHVDFAAARRQLAEAQLSMMEEAARRLYASGLDINTLPVRRVLEELKSLELEKYASVLRSVNAPDTVENIGQLNNLNILMKESRPFTNNVFAFSMSDSDFDITSIHEAVESARTARLLSDLETFQTVPDPKYKDSFAKVRSQIAPFVEGIGLDASTQNVKAAAILSKNEMDVTVENILIVKTVDAKLEFVYDRLHPSIAASMIKDGYNPTKMHLDDMAAYIDKFNNEYGENLTERIPNYIAKMDKDKTLTSDERDAMIAIYRLLNNIQKNGAAAIGVIVKSDVDMTLGNMLEAAKSFKNTQNLDYQIDDEFFGTEVTTDNNEGSIYGAFAKTEAQHYNEMVVKQLAHNAQPDALKKLLENAMDIPIDELNSLLADIKQSDAGYNEQIRPAVSFNENLNVTTETVKYMMANNIPMTLANMGIVQSLLKNPNYIADKLDELIHSEVGDTIAASLPDFSLEAVAQGEEAVLQNLSNSLDKAWNESDNPEVLRKINIVQNAMSLHSFMPKTNESSLKLPINFGGKITNLSMYVLNGNADLNGDTSVLISLKTDSLGEVNITIAVENGNVKAAVIGENERSLNYLMQERGTLQSLLDNAGFELSELKFRLKGQNDVLQEASLQTTERLTDENSKYEMVV